MTLKWTHRRYLEYDIGCLSVPKKTKEKGSTNGSTFTPLYNGIEDSYGIDSIGYLCVIGVLERNSILAGDTKFLRVVLKFSINRLRNNKKEIFNVL